MVYENGLVKMVYRQVYLGKNAILKEGSKWILILPMSDPFILGLNEVLKQKHPQYAERHDIIFFHNLTMFTHVSKELPRKL